MTEEAIVMPRAFVENFSNFEKIRFSYFKSPHGVEAQVVPCDFDELVYLLSFPMISRGKGSDSMSPFVYRSNYRKKDNALTADLIILDIDGAPTDVTAEMVVKNVHPYSAVAYSTFSHLHEGKDGRFRLLVLVKESIPATQYRQACDQLCGLMGDLSRYVDDSSKSTAQQFYLPSVREEDQGRFDFAYFQGEPFDWKGSYPVKLIKKVERKIMNNNFKIGIGKIFEGHRNKTLSAEAYRMRRAGMNESEILSIIRERNLNDCIPPLEDAEINQICASAAKIEVVHHSDFFFHTPLTHGSFAEYVIKKSNGSLKYVLNTKKWMQISREGLWIGVTDDEVKKIIRDTLLLAIKEVELQSLNDEYRNSFRSSLKASNTASFLNGTYSLLSTQDDVHVYPDQFDSNIYLVGLKDGMCYDLEKSEVRRIEPSDYLTKCLGTHYDQAATCELWEKCMEEWTCGDQELKKYLQIFCGYCLSGETTQQCINFMHGNGANGKSVFQSVILKMMNHYGVTVDASTLMDSKRTAGAASSDIARLKGARVVISTELPASRSFNEELLKSITGGDKIVTRHLYGSEFEFVPQLKLFIVGNHTPVIRSTDNGIWRRMKLVPFDAEIKVKDPCLQVKLFEELSGIFNWMIEGWSIYKKKGSIDIPESIQNASKEYREDMDIMGSWISECLLDDADGRVQSSVLYACYKQWCEKNSYLPLCMKHWSREYRSRTGNGCKMRGSKGSFFTGKAII